LRLAVVQDEGKRMQFSLDFAHAYAVLTDLQRAGTAIYALTLPWVDRSKARVLDAYLDVFRASEHSFIGRRRKRIPKMPEVVRHCFACFCRAVWLFLKFS